MSYLSVGRTLGSSLREAFGLWVGVLSIKAWWVEWLGSGPWEPVNQKQRLPGGRAELLPSEAYPGDPSLSKQHSRLGQDTQTHKLAWTFHIQTKTPKSLQHCGFFYTPLEEQVSIPLPVMTENLVLTSLCELRMVLTLT